jgi:hypothetical protein
MAEWKADLHIIIARTPRQAVVASECALRGSALQLAPPPRSC